MIDPRRYITSHDPATGSNDYTTLVILKKLPNGELELVDNNCKVVDEIDNMYNKWRQLMKDVYNREY